MELYFDDNWMYYGANPVVNAKHTTEIEQSLERIVSKLEKTNSKPFPMDVSFRYTEHSLGLPVIGRRAKNRCVRLFRSGDGNPCWLHFTSDLRLNFITQQIGSIDSVGLPSSHWSQVAPSVKDAADLVRMSLVPTNITEVRFSSLKTIIGPHFRNSNRLVKIIHEWAEAESWAKE